jgi:ferredoxin
MTKYKIEFDREVCIGALACTAVAENFWPRSEDGKVDLTGATFNEYTKKWELIIDENDFEINNDAAESCPVEAIKIIKLEEKEESKSESSMDKNRNETQDDSIDSNNDLSPNENSSINKTR